LSRSNKLLQNGRGDGPREPHGAVDYLAVPQGHHNHPKPTGTAMSDEFMRDFFLPVTAPARQQAHTQGFPLTGR
jgi:hypothetical protein